MLRARCTIEGERQRRFVRSAVWTLADRVGVAIFGRALLDGLAMELVAQDARVHRENAALAHVPAQAVMCGLQARPGQ